MNNGRTDNGRTDNGRTDNGRTDNGPGADHGQRTNRGAFSRRSFLAATGISAGLVPLLEPTRRVHAAPTPGRLIVITVPNGYTADYPPEFSGDGWKARTAKHAPLAPLEPFADRVLVMGGINIQNGIDTARAVKRDASAKIGGHASLPFLLTGAKGVAGPRIPDGWSLTANHPSVDQYVVQNQPGAAALPFPSLVMRPVRLPPGGYGNNPLSYHGGPITKDQHNAPAIRDDPRKIFDDLFGGSLPDDVLAKTRARRRSILDFAASHLTQLEQRVGTADRQRLQQHQDGIRQVEKQISQIASGCERPEQPSSGVFTDNQFNPMMDRVMRAQMDMTVAAMSCGLTRVASLSWAQANNNTITFPWLADREPSLNGKWGTSNNAGSGNDLFNHHTIAHNEGELRDEKNLVDQFFIESYAYLIEKLLKTNDAQGTPLLDNTLVLFANQQRTGGGHQTDNLIWFLAGNANNHFKTGRYIPWVSGTERQTAPTNGILTSIVNAVGCPPVTHFADPEYGGPASILER